MGENGYWVFLDAAHLQTIVASYWKGFIALSIIVMSVTVGSLWALGTRLRKMGKPALG
jgi:hypothetical protein